MTTRQTAINQLVGGQGTAGKVLRSDGTNVSMSSLVSTDLPTVGIAQGGTGVSNKTTL